jgi:hypothetical protein
MSEALSLREINLRVFRGLPLPHIFFQPRFEPWYDLHRLEGTLPHEIQELSLLQVYDLLGASMRTVHYYTGQPDPIEISYTDEVKISEQRQGNRLIRCYQTHHGPLYEAEQLTIDRAWRTVEFAAKSAQDLPALGWLLARRVIQFNPDKFKQGTEYIGQRGEPSFWVPKSPYLALAQQWMKYTDFIYALTDYRAAVEDIMAAIDDSYDALYEQLISSGLMRILNFGENIAMAYLSLRYFEGYLAPWYEKRSGSLRRAGIFTHIHIDGFFKPLLPYLKDLPFDGYEALTPKPQGDVTLEEIREHIGGKVLLDGIPAVLFLRHHSREELQDCVEQIIELFHPRLVLGISDELPEGGDEESFERLKWVAHRCQTYTAQDTHSKYASD